MSSRIANSEVSFTNSVLTPNLWPQAVDTETASTDYQDDVMPENLPLSPLHDAAERGDDFVVRKLISSGNVALNAKAGGHRAMRTALHRAAGYGHVNIVKDLLKVKALD